MSGPIDILGIGCVAVDDLVYVEDYPAADSKTQITERERQCGGLTATALVAAARLGARCSFAATLGDDELSRFALDRLQQEGIDLQWIRRDAEARPIHSIIIIDQRRGTRTIFYDLDGVQTTGADWPDEDAVRAARVLFVDHVVAEDAIRAAAIARAAGIPVVADLENDRSPRFSELLGLVDHLIVSRSFSEQLTGATDPAEAAQALVTSDRRAVVVTCGDQGCWYWGSDDPVPPRHQPAFEVNVVDTTGCGDVFHGAYAAALAEGLDLASRIRLAAATAALSATRSGGQAGIPARQTVEAFLEEQL
jgi:sulfofructose kinase